MDGLGKANLVVWIFAIILIAFTFVQAALFVRRALQFNKKHHIYTSEELKSCVKTGIIAAIGPGVNTVFLGISLLALMGSGYTFLRLGVIGAPMFELMVVQYAAQFAGIDLSHGLTPSILTFMVFAGCIGTACYVIAPIFTLRPIEMAGKSKDGKPSMIMRVLPKVSIAIMFVLAIDYCSAKVTQAAAYIVGFLVGAVVFAFVSKGHKKLAPWALLFSSIGGITAAQIISTMIPA